MRADAALAEKAANDKRRGDGIDSNHIHNNNNVSSSSSSSSSSGDGTAAAPPPPYYALHVRRGDFQFKEVKISAEEIIQNLKGNAIIPRGSIVYVSTDDPKGVCVGCTYKKKPCPTGPEAAHIVGCIEDPSWDAFRTKAGSVRMLCVWCGVVWCLVFVCVRMQMHACTRSCTGSTYTPISNTLFLPAGYNIRLMSFPCTFK